MQKSRPVTHKTFLVLADISGFTQFMKSHENNASHAMTVVVELLRAVIAAAAPPLKLAEVEGDAAFFYALCEEDGEDARTSAAIKRQIMNFFQSFDQTLQRLCVLYPCVRNARDLRLKVVVHAGEVALEHIHGFEKLFGMDVILAHRLLKNSVPARQYVLMTKAAHKRLGDFSGLKPEEQIEYCEGIGVVDAVVFHLPEHCICPDNLPRQRFDSNRERRLSLVDLRHTSCSRFGTATHADLLSEPFHPNARAEPAAQEEVEARFARPRIHFPTRPSRQHYAFLAKF